MIYLVLTDAQKGLSSMGMFFDVLLEKEDDATLVLRGFQPESLDTVLSFGRDQGFSLPESCPVCLGEVQMGGRSKRINQDNLGHPVNYRFHISVRQSRIKDSGDLIASVLGAILGSVKGALSLTSYGESLLLRKQGDVVEIYDAKHFWSEIRLAVLHRQPGLQLDVTQDPKLF